MSYNLFLLLNVNHEKEGLLDYIGRRLQRNGPDSFCFDPSSDLFYSIEYLKEGQDSSLCIDIPFGGEEEVFRQLLDFMTYLQQYIQFQVLDPQLGKLLEPSDTGQIIDKWRSANHEALESYGDGRHFVRNLEERDGKKVMIEAIRFNEETWQNHCSVALAYNRILDASSALKHFQRAFELAPDNAAILHAIGVAHYNLHQYKRAAEALVQYLQSDPENNTARELLRDCELRLKAQ